MSFTHKVFDFDGRIGRIAYLLYTILDWLVTAMVVVAGLVLTRPGLTMIPGILLVAAAAVSLIWVNLALTVKRLHDTGRSGAHAIWIALLGALTVVSAFHRSVLALVLAAAIVGVFCWLVYVPGDEGRNLFGPAPDGARPPDAIGH